MNLKFADVEKGAGDNMTVSFMGKAEIDEIKLFFWDYTSMAPCVEPVIIY